MDFGKGIALGYDVFVSYSSKDKAIADAVVSSLEKNNIRCWYAPRDVKPGEDWGESITNAIEQCEIFLLIFSGNANKSQHVLDEILYAIGEQRTILPFRIENLDPTGSMKLHLSSRHWLDAYDPSWEAYIKGLVSYISIIVQKEIEEEQVQIPQEVNNQRGRNKKLALIFSCITALVVISIGGWYAFRALFSPKQQSVMTAAPSPTEQQTQTMISSDSPTITPEAGEDIGTIQEEVVLNLAYSIANPSVLDPQKANSNEERALAENIFISLTHFNSATYEIEPEAAESWIISPDRKNYTFIIRQDIPWVITTSDGQTDIVRDQNGAPRYVSPSDFEYAIRRSCIEGTNYPIVGCSEASAYDDPENIPDEIYAAIGVNAIGIKLSIDLVAPSASFLVTTSELNFSPLPSWAIEEYGYAWADPGNIQTNGRYVIGDIKAGERVTLIRNSFLPKDLLGKGNIDQINIQLNVPVDDQYNFWIDGSVDFSIIPDEIVVEHKIQYPEEVLAGEKVGFLIFFFNMNKAPFDNIHVRRAFAAALDKDDFVQNYLPEVAVPKNDLFLSGVFDGPGYELDSLGFDPEFAKSELAEGGYENCVGLPTVNICNATAAIQFPDQAIRNWEAVLGCPENTIQIDPGVWNEQKTDLLLWAFGGDIPELLSNFHEAMLSCSWSGGFRFSQECSEFENLLVETDQASTINDKLLLLQQCEETVFGIEGDFSMMPICQEQTWYAVNQRLEIDSPIHLSSEYYNWILNLD